MCRCRVVGARLVAMVTSKAMLPFRVIGPSAFKAPAPKLNLSMSLISDKEIKVAVVSGVVRAMPCCKTCSLKNI